MIYIINCGSSKMPQISNTLTELGFVSTVVPMEKTGTIVAAKGYIISGSPILLSQTDQLSYLKIFEFITKTELPVLGICFGHQILGLLNGSEVYLGKAERLPIEIETVQKSKLFKDITPIAVFDQDHTEGITLPAGFLHLAKSKNYEVEAMKHASKPVYGVQFHPETSGENGKIVLRNFGDICYR